MIFSKKVEVVKTWFRSDNGQMWLARFARSKQALKKDRKRRMLRRSVNSEKMRRIDYNMSAWGKLIRHPNVKDASSYHGKLFRRRFRVPFPVFEHLVDVCEEYNIFEVKRKDKVLIPIAIKLLCCLRMLGRGNCADDIAEMAQVGESTVNSIFKIFCRNFRKVMQPIHIPTPDDDEY